MEIGRRLLDLDEKLEDCEKNCVPKIMIFLPLLTHLKYCKKKILYITINEFSTRMRKCMKLITMQTNYNFALNLSQKLKENVL